MKTKPPPSKTASSARARKRAAALKQSVSRASATSSPRKDLVLEQLLNKAAELFLQRGYANTRMQDIAESMQMSRSSLYHYFENKEEVLLALTEGDGLQFSGMILTPDGRTVHRIAIDGKAADAASLGRKAGEEVRAIAGSGFFEGWS